MAACWCSLAGTAACQHCQNNPMATDVWTNKTVMIDHVEAKPFGNGIDVCPVCGSPSTIGKPVTNADRIRVMTDEELAELWWERVDCGECPVNRDCKMTGQDCKKLALGWLREEAKE